MIIVNQDKTMIFNYKNIETIGIGNPLENDDGKFAILIETISDNQYPIALYETEERAKEVLQEIINTYLDCNEENIYEKFAYVKNKVFEMPIK